MQDVMAQVIEQIGAGAASVDGKYLLLKVTMDGRERIFAFQEPHVIALISITCGVRTENERITPSGSSGVFGVEAFELAETTDGNVVRSSSARAVDWDFNSTVPGRSDCWNACRPC